MTPQQLRYLVAYYKTLEHKSHTWFARRVAEFDEFVEALGINNMRAEQQWRDDPSARSGDRYLRRR